MFIRPQSLLAAMCVLAVLSGGVASGGDKEISEWVTNALAQDQRVDNVKVHVATRDGIVTLAGQVPTLAAKEFASQEASKIDGVSGVVNQITIDTEKRSDDEIVRDIQRRIEHNASITTKGLRVGCLNGFVTLSGEVVDYAEELEAEDIASEVRGVKQVENHLLTAFFSKRSDKQTEQDVLATLVRDVYLNDAAVAATVKGGVVILSGTVGSAYAKQRAMDEVQEIRQVKSVVNQLNVDPLALRGEKAAYNWPSEEDLEAALKKELMHDSRVDAETIEVSVEYGHVDLEGTVRTQREKRFAEYDAFDIIGVQSVDNRLTVTSDTRDDSQIASDVILDLSSDAVVHPFDVKAKSDAGTITLTGNVDTLYQRAQAEDLAARVRGVTSVDNQIAVDSKAELPDADVTKAITQRWKQNQVTKVCKLIQADVKAGIVTLTGNVDSWAEYQEAARVAFHTVGVRQVKNHLVVEGFDYPWEQFRGDNGQDFDPSAPQIHQFLFN